MTIDPVVPAAPTVFDQARARDGSPRFERWLEFFALIYIGFPSVIFLYGWFPRLYGIAAAASLVVCLYAFRPSRMTARACGTGPSWSSIALVTAIAIGWAILGGTGHLVYANFDWEVRDAVLSDLVRNAWPVVYPTHGSTPALLLRAPLGIYLPVALIGKLTTALVADFALLIWIIGGVLLTLLLLLRDRPRLPTLMIRLAVFVVFSGMDVVGEITHYGTYAVGQHLEWWAYLFQYPSQTTQLFWAPNHCLPGWIVVAWLLGYRGRTLPVAHGIAMLALVPFWSPLAAIGVAPLLMVSMIAALRRSDLRTQLAQWFDPRVVLMLLICVAFVYPYLVLGSENVPSGLVMDVPWVGEDFIARYIEFVLLEFGFVAVLLVVRFRFDAMLIAAIVTLLLIPIFQFGPANDLALRASNPSLALLAIYTGEWLGGSTRGRLDRRCRWVVIALLAVGAVTPFNEVARIFIEPRWPFDSHTTLLEATKRTVPHYVTIRDRPWPNQFLRPPADRNSW